MDQREIIESVAEILGVKQIAWSRAMKVCKECLDNGFTADDILIAAKNMTLADKKFWSLYSVFIKTDYWMTRMEKQEKPKGVW